MRFDLFHPICVNVQERVCEVRNKRFDLSDNAILFRDTNDSNLCEGGDIGNNYWRRRGWVRHRCEFVHQNTVGAGKLRCTPLIACPCYDDAARLAWQVIENGPKQQKFSLVDGRTPIFRLHDGDVSNPSQFELPKNIDLVDEGLPLERDVVFHLDGTHRALIEDLLKDLLRNQFVRDTSIRGFVRPNYSSPPDVS